MPNANRSYQFAIVTYLDEEEIKIVINRKRTVLRSWAYIKHDKDPADTHFHIVFLTYDAKTCTAIQKWFPERQNTFVQKITDKQAIFDYLTHKNDPEKTQYDVSEIVSDNLMDVRGNRFEAYDKSFDILCDLCARVPMIEMVRRYGRDFIIHYEQYDRMAGFCKYELERKEYGY